MGNKISIKLMVLTMLFLCICVAAQGRIFREKPIEPNTPLKQVLNYVDGYTLIRNIELGHESLKMLDTDDYFFADFKSNNGKINLYIGYYYSSEKAYSSHSPMVCYPSHGWEIVTQPKQGELTFNSHKINYNYIVSSSGIDKEIVFYWYQARDRANTSVYRNKIDIGYNKLMYNDDAHGFLRIAIPFTKSNIETSKQTAFDFIKAFYPQVILYLSNA